MAKRMDYAMETLSVGWLVDLFVFLLDVVMEWVAAFLRRLNGVGSGFWMMKEEEVVTIEPNRTQNRRTGLSLLLRLLDF